MDKSSLDPTPRYYVYIYYAVDGVTPIYIGKGQGDRAETHKSSSDNLFLHTYLRRHPSSKFKFAAQNLTERQAFELETKLIAKYGRRIENTGPLFNVLEGGEDEYPRRRGLKFRGKWYASLKLLAEAHGVDYHRFYLRVMRYGWTFDEALELQKRPHRRGGAMAQPIKYKGRTYPSLRALAEQFDVPYKVFHRNIRGGWSIEQALGHATRESINPGGRGKQITCDGKTYKSVSALASAFGITSRLAYDRLRAGWSPEETVGLVERPQSGKSATAVRAFGESFDSLAELARHPKCVVSYSHLQIRVNQGMSPQKAASTPWKYNRAKKQKHWRTFNFQGKQYDSMSALARAFNMSRAILRKRLLKGWKMEEALGLESRFKNRPGKPIVIAGRKFKSQSAAARYYGIGAHKLSERLRRGWTPEEAVKK